MEFGKENNSLRVFCIGGNGISPIPHPHMTIGARGFEPPTARTPSVDSYKSFIFNKLQLNHLPKNVYELAIFRLTCF